MNKPAYLDLSILRIRELVMYAFWYDDVKLKYEEKAELCYLDTDSFIVYIKAGDIYVYTAKLVEARFHTPTYKLERLLPPGKNKK